MTADFVYLCVIFYPIHFTVELFDTQNRLRVQMAVK